MITGYGGELVTARVSPPGSTRLPDGIGGGSHQPRSRHSPRCGRSVPSVVSLPCPGYTQVASGSGPNRRSVTSVSSEVKSAGELVLPTIRAEPTMTPMPTCDLYLRLSDLRTEEAFDKREAKL